MKHVESNQEQVYTVYGRNPDEAADNALKYAHNTYGGGNFNVVWVRPAGDVEGAEAAAPAQGADDGAELEGN